MSEKMFFLPQMLDFQKSKNKKFQVLNVSKKKYFLHIKRRLMQKPTFSFLHLYCAFKLVQHVGENVGKYI